MLGHDPADPLEDLACSLEIAARPAGIRHQGRGQGVEVEVPRHPGIPIRDLPGQISEVIRLVGPAGDVPAARLQEQAHEGRATEAGSRALDADRAFSRGEREDLLEILLGTANLTRPRARSRSSRTEKARRTRLQMDGPAWTSASYA